jgi:uncharacterized glyoxalase superfamily protein PhnB
MRIDSVVPIVIPDSIEPLLPFWVERAGLAKQTSVDEATGMGFAILGEGRSEIMFQTKSSLADDLPAVAAQNLTVILYAHVDSIDELEASIGDAEVLVPRRTTFYGAIEVGVRDRSGAIVGFSQSADGQGEAAHETSGVGPAGTEL